MSEEDESDQTAEYKTKSNLLIQMFKEHRRFLFSIYLCDVDVITT